MYVLYGSSFSRFSQQGAIEYNQSITQPAIKLSIEKQLLHIATFLETFCLQTITIGSRSTLTQKIVPIEKNGVFYDLFDAIFLFIFRVNFCSNFWSAHVE